MRSGLPPAWARTTVGLRLAVANVPLRPETKARREIMGKLQRIGFYWGWFVVNRELGCQRSSRRSMTASNEFIATTMNIITTRPAIVPVVLYKLVSIWIFQPRPADDATNSPMIAPIRA